MCVFAGIFQIHSVDDTYEVSNSRRKDGTGNHNGLLDNDEERICVGSHSDVWRMVQ